MNGKESTIATRGARMLGQSENEEKSDRACQGAAANQSQCNLAATVHCNQCDLWFCDVHAEDDEWHACMKAS